MVLNSIQNKILNTFEIKCLKSIPSTAFQILPKSANTLINYVFMTRVVNIYTK